MYQKERVGGKLRIKAPHGMSRPRIRDAIRPAVCLQALRVWSAFSYSGHDPNLSAPSDSTSLLICPRPSGQPLAPVASNPLPCPPVQQMPRPGSFHGSASSAGLWSRAEKVLQPGGTVPLPCSVYSLHWVCSTTWHSFRTPLSASSSLHGTSSQPDHSLRATQLRPTLPSHCMTSPSTVERNTLDFPAPDPCLPLCPPPATNLSRLHWHPLPARPRLQGPTLPPMALPLRWH